MIYLLWKYGRVFNMNFSSTSLPTCVINSKPIKKIVNYCNENWLLNF